MAVQKVSMLAVEMEQLKVEMLVEQKDAEQGGWMESQKAEQKVEVKVEWKVKLIMPGVVALQLDKYTSHQDAIKEMTLLNEKLKNTRLAKRYPEQRLIFY